MVMIGLSKVYTHAITCVLHYYNYVEFFNVYFPKLMIRELSTRKI